MVCAVMKDTWILDKVLNLDKPVYFSYSISLIVGTRTKQPSKSYQCERCLFEE